MKKTTLLLAGLLGLTGPAVAKGRFEVHDLGNFRLHVYYTDDALGDASYIVEGRQSLVTLEQPLFKENVAAYDAYVDSLGKPVERRITDYHVGGTGREPVVMPEGMAAFVKGGVYGGMMEGFARTFGDAIVESPTGTVSEVPYAATQTWAGVAFTFRHGAATDFPAASILIGDAVYYTHWAPVRAHANVLQVGSMAAVDAEMAEARRALQTGCKLFIGGHGGAVTADDVRFKIGYLEKSKDVKAAAATPEAFATAMAAAYPGLPGSDGLAALAQALYK